MPLNTGKMRHRVDIEERIETRDTMGGQSAEWKPVAKGVYARFEPWKGRELYVAQQIRPEVEERIRIRYRVGIDAAQRVRYRGVIYGILYIINPEEKNEELVLMCSKGLNEG